MLEAYVLVLWTTVACGSTGHSSCATERKDWRPIAEFRTKEYCMKGAAELGLEPKRFRCIATGKF